MVTAQLLRRHREIVELVRERRVRLEIAEHTKISATLGHEANHQGIILKADLTTGEDSTLTIEDIIPQACKTSTLVMLDRVTDINNVGSILRSSACFGVDALVLPMHHSPSERCMIAKAASGAMELVPIIYVQNLISTIKYLRKEGYWCYGLATGGCECLSKVNFCDRRVIVLGSEGKGMRRLVAEHCDYLIRIPMSPAKIESLNVSNAAAIALYSVYSQHIRTCHD